MKDFARSILIYGIASGISKSLMILLVPIYTKLFTADQFAVIDLITSLFFLIGLISLLQLESALSRYYYEGENKDVLRKYVSSTVIFVIITSCLFTLITILFSKPISQLLFHQTIYSKPIEIAALSLPFLNLFAILTVLLRFEKKMLLYLIFVVSQVFFTVTVTILFVKYFESGIEGVFYGQLIGYIFPIAFISFFMKDFLSFELSKSTLKQFLKYSLPLLPSVVGNWINTYISRFIMLAYLPLAEIGVYSASVKISSALNILQFAFSMAWIPFLFETIKQENFQPIIRKIFVLSTLLIFSISILFSVWADIIMELFTSGAYLKGASYVGIICLSLALNFLFQIVCIGPSISTKTIYNTITFFISVITNILLLYLLIPHLAITGVLIAYFTSSLIMFLSGWYFSEKLFPIHFSFKTFIICLLVTFVVIMITSFYTFPLIGKIGVTLTLAGVIGKFALDSDLAKSIILKFKSSKV